MKEGSFRQNLLFAISAQAISLVASIATTLFLPRILGVSGFGYWQLVTFYTSYVGFAHLGLNDGIYLLNGGKTQSQLDVRSIRSQFVIGFTYQLVFAILLFAVAWSPGGDPNRKFVILTTSIVLLLTNLAGFIGSVFQAINQTRLFSASTMVATVVFLLGFAALAGIGVTDFRWYVAAKVFSLTASMFFCLWFGRWLVFGRLERVREAIRDTWQSITVGVSLMLAIVASMAVIGVSRVFVDLNWGITSFSKYSLALAFVSLLMLFVQQIAMVLFPVLRRVTGKQLRLFFVRLRDLLGILLPGLFLLYFPLSRFISRFLPDYTDSALILSLLLPLMIFEAKMALLGTPLLKVVRGERTLLWVNVGAVILSALTAWLGVHLGSIEAVAIGVSFSVAARFVVTNWVLSARLEVTVGTLDVIDIAISAVFVASVLTMPAGMSMLVTSLCWFIVCIAYRNRLKISLEYVLKRAGRASP